VGGDNGIDGRWEIEVSTPFGTHPATLTIERAGEEFGGRIVSRLGAAPLTDITPTADGFEAVVSLELQGRTYDARVSATLDGEGIEGRIKVNIPLAPPARFAGSRARA
jgi:hypothetical protein